MPIPRTPALIGLARSAAADPAAESARLRLAAGLAAVYPAAAALIAGPVGERLADWAGFRRVDLLAVLEVYGGEPLPAAAVGPDHVAVLSSALQVYEADDAVTRESVRVAAEGVTLALAHVRGGVDAAIRGDDQAAELLRAAIDLAERMVAALAVVAAAADESARHRLRYVPPDCG